MSGENKKCNNQLCHVPEADRKVAADPQRARPLSICLIGASFQTGNLGVSALASGAIRALLHADPSSRVFFLDYELKAISRDEQCEGEQVRIELVNIRFNKNVLLANNIARLIISGLLMRLIRSRLGGALEFESNTTLRAINQADIVAAISGGDSFSDLYGLRRLVYVALPQILTLTLGKPLTLLPQTYGPFKSQVARKIARFILGRAETVYSRDREGLETVRKLLGHRGLNARFCYDVGFVLEPGISEERTPAWLVERSKVKPLIGLNVSGLLWTGGYSRDNMFKLKCNYRQLVGSLISYFVQEHGSDVMLVPHVVSGAGSESDATACKEVYDRASEAIRKNLCLLDPVYDQHEIKGLIGKCNFFLGSRMHACIAALSQCVPAVGLAYSVKFKGVFESIDMDESVIDLREHDIEQVVDTVAGLYEFRGKLQSTLEVKMPAVRKHVLDLFKAMNSHPDH
ncbi:MAG: polysaccharide pyruvyl transferase family protein [Syntrophobacteraceae bacterium]